MLAEFIRLQGGTNEEQVHFPILLSADSVLRSQRNLQIKAGYKAAAFKLGYCVAILITFFFFVFLWNLLSVVPWADNNTHKPGCEAHDLVFSWTGQSSRQHSCTSTGARTRWDGNVW